MARKSHKTADELAALPKRRKRMPEPMPAPIEPDWIGRVVSPAARHHARLAQRMTKPKQVEREHARELLERMRAGEMPVEICDATHMPSYSAFVRLMRTDEQFAADYDEAYRALADATLEDAARFAREVTDLENVDAQRTADIYAKTVIATLEKLAPKTHGVLVKHAGSDGGALTVQVVDYARPKQLE